MIFNGNPIYWADPNGMAGERYDWDTGKYVNNQGKEVSFETALVSATGKGSEEKDSNDNNMSDVTSINPKSAFEYVSKYPRTMQIMRQLKGFVKSNPEILKQLAKFSGYSSMEVLNQLEFDRGRTFLTIEDLSYDWRGPNGITQAGSATDFSLEILLAERLEVLENNQDIQTYSFYIAVTILHEFVHAGRNANNMDNGGNEKFEMGWGWEEKAFGSRVNGDTYKELYQKSNWNLNNYPTKPLHLKPPFKN